jgi:Domain of unknown function (DUF1906)
MIANAHVFTAPDGQMGFDCDHALTADECKLFVDASYAFVVRYVPRTTRHPQDLTADEVDVILTSGLGLMVVQHVEAADPPWWVPSGEKGGNYGATASRESIACGIPSGVSVWCDLEGVDPHAPASAVLDYCTRWFKCVAAAGFLPGLYVGYNPGLSPSQLYSLPFTHYWSSYNLNTDQYPAVRGVQMKQSEYPGVDDVPGIGFQFDVNHTMADKLGGRCQLLSVPPFGG